MSISFGFDVLGPVRAEVHALLARIERGEVVDHTVERRWVDLKEEAGRRNRRTGAVLHAGSRNDEVAKHLAPAAACMANTPGGGALIVGVADDGALVGAESDAEWLRQRIYELTRRLLTPDVTTVQMGSTRLLVIVCPAAVEPIRMDDKIRWRVGDRCLEVDAATWHAKRMSTLNYDWSADSSGLPADSARPQALAVARDFLQAAATPAAVDLAAQGDEQMLRRLGAVTGDGLLTNAAALVFVGRGQAAIDYVHRDVAGGDSTARTRRPGRSLLEELAEVFLYVDAHTSIRHVQDDLVVAQVKDLPSLAAREAVVNGVAHREWGVADPTLVEHIGGSLRVTSPGGFFGGVTESNILTHPSTSRNAALTLLLADLHVAEREGIGVDRMTREMLRAGHQPPVIREIDGPRVRASLVGEIVDTPWVTWLARLEPRSEGADVNSLLLLRRLVAHCWVDLPTAAAIVQLGEDEAQGALVKLGRAQVSGEPLLASVEGVPEHAGPVWRLSDHAASTLSSIDEAHGRDPRWPSRAAVASSYAQSRGRISSTELGSMVSVAPSNVGGVLKELQAQGVLEPSTAAGRGRGFYYRWIGHGPAR